MNGQHDHPAPAENQQVKGYDKVMEPYRGLIGSAVPGNDPAAAKIDEPATTRS